jgi:hypothetical protein
VRVRALLVCACVKCIRSAVLGLVLDKTKATWSRWQRCVACWRISAGAGDRRWQLYSNWQASTLRLCADAGVQHVINGRWRQRCCDWSSPWKVTQAHCSTVLLTTHASASLP